MSCFRGLWDFFCRGFVPTSVASVASILLSLQACHHVVVLGWQVAVNMFPWSLLFLMMNGTASVLQHTASVVWWRHRSHPVSGSIHESDVHRRPRWCRLFCIAISVCVTFFSTEAQRRAPLPRVQWVSAPWRCGRRCVVHVLKLCGISFPLEVFTTNRTCGEWDHSVSSLSRGPPWLRLCRVVSEATESNCHHQVVKGVS